MADTVRIGSLFSGAGGLDLAVETVFGGRTAWHSELDPAASTVLAYRFPGVPNLGDITKVSWAEVEPVDVLCGGFPCQDVSAAGRRAGIRAGTRSGLWAIFADAIAALRPRYVVIENVRGLLSAEAHRDMESDDATVGDGPGRPVLRAAGAVLGDLADLGYDAQWTTIAASDVGAPHRRERVFILAVRRATSDTSDAAGHRQRSREKLGQGSEGVAADTASDGRTQLVDGAGSAAARSGREWQPAGSAGHSAASDAARYGRNEGWPEPTGFVGGSDAAERSDGHAEPVAGALLPTPNAADSERGGRCPESARLAGHHVKLIDAVIPLLPTPAACNPNEGEGTETWLARRDAVKGRVGNGNGMGMPLNIAVQLLPTPSVADGEGGHLTRSGERGDELLLPGIARAYGNGELLPTPTTQDGANNGGPSQFERNTPPLNAVATLLPTPAAADSQRRQDYSRANRPMAGGDDLVTATVRAQNTDQWGKYAGAVLRWESVVGNAPAPTQPNRNGNPRLNPAFSEWMMGWLAGWVTAPEIGISRNNQLRIIGNGVCPQQAIAALIVLLQVCVVAA